MRELYDLFLDAVSGIDRRRERKYYCNRCNSLTSDSVAFHVVQVDVTWFDKIDVFKVILCN